MKTDGIPNMDYQSFNYSRRFYNIRHKNKDPNVVKNSGYLQIIRYLIYTSLS